MTFFTSSREETISLGKKIGLMLKKGDVLAMNGTLGAGKTTFTQGIAQALEVNDIITSPTYCLVSEYEGKLPLYHMDVYRLNGEDDFINLGVEDLIYGRGVSIIEWPDKIMNQLPEKTIKVFLEIQENSDNRKITIENWPYGEIK